MTTGLTSSSTPAYLIRFPSLFQNGRGMAFPCDSNGTVNIDELTERGRLNYFFARAMIGRDFGFPIVCVE